MHDVKKVTLQAMLLEALFWMSSCAYGSFIVTTLTDYGYSSATATALMTVMAAVSFVAQPITGYLCDNYFSQRKAFLVLIGCSVPLYLLLTFSMKSLPLTVLFMFLLTLAMQQVPGLVDAWVVHMQGRYPGLNYGLWRGTGSLMYAVAAQVMGGLTVAWGHDLRMVVGAVLGVGALVVAWRLGEMPSLPSTDDPVPAAPRRLSTGETVRRMGKNHTYLLLLGMSFALFLGSSCISTFMPVLVADLGGDSGHVGTAFAVTALSEVPAMFLMRAILRRFPARRVLIFGCFFYVTRLTLTCLSPNLTAMLAIQLLQGLSFAVLWPASINYLNRIVEDEIKSTAVMTYTSVTLGISGIFGNAIGTMILSATDNVRLVFAFSACSAAVGLALGIFGLVRRIWK